MFENIRHELSELVFMNRYTIRLLDETNEEFEYKILKNVLYALEDIYVFYKQLEFLGIDNWVKL